MKRQDFHYQLPEHLIARYPCADRTNSRLLHLQGNTGQIQHLHFRDILQLLKSEDLLVFNNTKVIPARFYGRKPSGGKIEVLLERILDENTALAHIRASKAPKPGSTIQLLDSSQLRDSSTTEGTVYTEATILGRHNNLFEIQLASDYGILETAEAIGHMPLPPYIDRVDELADKERYQTVYAQHPGAVAAPTAGLHFDEDLLEALQRKHVDKAFVTLHVGAGTFQPVRVDNIEDHSMHSEYIKVPQSVCDQISDCKKRGGRVIAVGTTSLRCLESAWLHSDNNKLAAYKGETDIFIYPGKTIHVVDCLITNFHLPESTLIMLVSAFAGHENIMQAYQAAMEEEYRFFSYGDAMLIEKQTDIES